MAVDYAEQLELEVLAAAPTSSISEASLVHGYSRAGPSPAAVEPCACGDRIVAISRSDADVSHAVLAHNRTPTHLRWAHAMGWV